MNADYLWDKTGEDAEIEKLESTLQVFRAQTDLPPPLPFQIAEEKSPRRTLLGLTIAFASAFSLACVLILIGAWFQLSTDDLPVGDNLTSTIVPEAGIEIPNRAPVEKPAGSMGKKSETGVLGKTKNDRPAAIRTRARANPKSKIQNPKSGNVRLTSEEKFAYDQLMMALSITGSKLKIVREKVENSAVQIIIVTKEDTSRRN